jgi:hypothetical protein
MYIVRNYLVKRSPFEEGYHVSLAEVFNQQTNCHEIRRGCAQEAR